jgi:hypothetical protein
MRTFGCHTLEPLHEVGEAPQRLLRLVERFPAELQLLPVVRGEQQIPQRRRPIAFRDDVR